MAGPFLGHFQSLAFLYVSTKKSAKMLQSENALKWSCQ